MSFNSDTIINASFSLARLGGYNKVEVDEMLETIANEYSKLENRLREAEKYKSKAQQFDENYKEIQEALVVAQKSKNSIIGQANADAEKLRSEAMLEAKNQLAEAKRKSGELERETRQNADEILKSASDEANRLAYEVQRDTQQLISESKKISKEIIDDAHSTAKKIIQAIENERNQYKNVHYKLLSIVNNLQSDLEHDDWLNEQLSYKTASFTQENDRQKSKETKQQKPSTNVKQSKKDVKVIKQSKQHQDAFGDLTEEQKEAFLSLQKSNETIQQTLIDSQHQKIETTEQVVDLMNKLQSNIEE